MKIIIGLMSIALIGLIAVQFYWMKNAIELEEKLFDSNVNDAMHSVIKKISQNESASFVVHKLLKPDDNVVIFSSDSTFSNKFIIPNKGTWVSKYNFQVSDSDVVIKLEAREENDSSKVIVEINRYENGNKIKRVEKKIISTVQIDSIKENKEKFVKEVVEELLLVGITQNIKDRINRNEVSEYLKENLNNNGITTDFIFGVESEGKNSLLFADDVDQIIELSESSYRAQLFPEEIFRSADYLLLYFPDRTGYLLRSVSTVLSISALFIFSIIFLYYKTVKILIRQKKIADIKNDLISNITHEFKTPIATISLAGEALLDPELSKDPASTHKYLAMIREESDRLKKMVDSFLNTALIENGEYNLEKSEIDIHSLIKNIVDRNKLGLNVSRNEITLELSADDHKIIVDEIHIVNVVSNIIDNAVKYSGEQPQVTIKTKNKDNGILIYISDKGIGIDKNQHKKIFETFYRIPTGNIHNTRGYGIGLSYVKKIVEAHGGSISVNSKPGSGTTFKLFLPNAR